MALAVLFVTFCSTRSHCHPRPICFFSCILTLPGRAKKARALATGEKHPDGDAETLDVLAAIKKFSGVRPDPEAFIEALDPLQPRLYSIASSPKLNPGRVALAVDTVRYVLAGRRRLGVALNLPTHRAGRQR